MGSGRRFWICLDEHRSQGFSSVFSGSIAKDSIPVLNILILQGLSEKLHSFSLRIGFDAYSSSSASVLDRIRLLRVFDKLERDKRVVFRRFEVSFQRLQESLVSGIGASFGSLLQAHQHVRRIIFMGRIRHITYNPAEGIFINVVPHSLAGRLHHLGYFDD